MNRIPILSLLALAACLRDVPAGPDPGPCAVVPTSGSYSWGEIGIGNCLAGPVDARFFEEDGNTWLAVSNADPYVSFGTGSLLLVAWSSIDFGVEQNILPSPTGGTDTSVVAHALPLDAYSGEIGILPGRDLAIVPSRITENSQTRVGLDDAQILDLANVTDPRPWAVDDRIKLRDDPELVVIDEDAELAYVGNLTDHSVSVIDWDPERPPNEGEDCDPSCALALVDVAPQAILSEQGFADAGIQSFAEVDGLNVSDAQALVDDAWTLTYSDASLRVWAAQGVLDDAGALTDALGVVRWTSAGQGEPYAESALGIELGPIDDLLTVEDPFIALSAGLPIMYFSDLGKIRSSATAGAAGEWLIPSAGVSVLDGSAVGLTLGAPSIAAVEGVVTLFYDQREGDGPATIGRSVSLDGVTFTLDDLLPVLDPADLPGFTSFEHPFVVEDLRTGTFRMWLSGMRDDGSWSVLLSESPDGVAWDVPTVILERTSTDLAAPVVGYVSGRYLLWVAYGDGSSWQTATAWSYDGVDWSAPIPEIPADVVYDRANPPRAAVQIDVLSSWSVRGADSGTLGVQAITGTRVGFTGLDLAAVGGHDVSNDVFDNRRGDAGMAPGSHIVDGDVERLYVTAQRPNGRLSLGVLEPLGEGWLPVGGDLIPVDTGGNITGASDPVVVKVGAEWHLFYAAADADGASTIRHATSADGLIWTPLGGAVAPSDAEWESTTRLPRSLEQTADGWRLWYTGSDGEIQRIGSATAATLDGDWTIEQGDFDPWVFGPGTPGSFDDAGVRDPAVWSDGVSTRMLYAGFDGATWHIGSAELVDGAWIRRTDPTGQSLPALDGIPGTFSTFGVESPVVAPDGDGGATVYYAGQDGFELRVGEGFVRADRQDVVFAAPRYPTAGDTLSFTSAKGGKAVTAIVLDQIVSEFTTDGIGMAAMIPDFERGFLYVPSKLSSFLYVVDIRDDTTLGFADTNYLDLEALVRVPSATGNMGFRGGVVSDERDRLYLTARSPDLIHVLDLTRIEDDGEKEVEEQIPVGTLPIRTLGRDEGATTLSLIGGNGMALAGGEELLLVSEYRSNLVDVYDLGVGAFGQLVREIPWVGENPGNIRISPDGMHAVVVNYTGEVTDDETSGTLAIIDLDPESPTYLEVVTWLANR